MFALAVAVVAIVATRRPQRATTTVAVTAARGPWGAIERMPFYLEQPARYLAPSACETTDPRWRLPGYTAARVRALIASAGVERAQAEALEQRTTCDAEGCVIAPGRDVVLALAGDARSALYSELARFRVNFGQAYAFMRPDDDPRWDSLSALVDPALVARLSWRKRGLVRISDLAPLCEQVTSDAARTTLLETLSRMSATMAWLVIEPGADVGPLVSYWSWRGSSRSLRPIFEAVARHPGGARLDLVNVLPPFARRRLNTFPYPDDPPRDCYWSALNFFATETPADTFVDGAGALAALERDYVRVPFEARRFGDVILFVQRGVGPVHAANHVADDLVFTKNGSHFRRPWTLMPLAEVQQLYPEADELRAYRLR